MSSDYGVQIWGGWQRQHMLALVLYTNGSQLFLVGPKGEGAGAAADETYPLTEDINIITTGQADNGNGVIRVNHITGELYVKSGSGALEEYMNAFDYNFHKISIYSEQNVARFAIVQVATPPQDPLPDPGYTPAPGIEQQLSCAKEFIVNHWLLIMILILVFVVVLLHEPRDRVWPLIKGIKAPESTLVAAATMAELPRVEENRILEPAGQVANAVQEMTATL